MHCLKQILVCRQELGVACLNTEFAGGWVGGSGLGIVWSAAAISCMPTTQRAQGNSQSLLAVLSAAATREAFATIKATNFVVAATLFL